MQSFIVLGIIPGTNIQIGFFVWIGIFAAILYFALRPLISYRRQVKAMRLMIDVRRPLPASQLHSRLR